METKLNQTDTQGRKQGPWEEHYANGNLWYKGSYLNDIEIGIWEWYWINGNLMYKGSYLDGKETGTWEWYDIEGNLKKVIYYH